MVGGRVAQSVEEPPAAARMAPAFGIDALGIGAHVQKLGPRSIVQLRGLAGPREVRLTAVGEFDFRAFTTVGADNEQHRIFRSVSHGRRRCLVYQVSVAETLDG